jgi:hypothetical protein
VSRPCGAEFKWFATGDANWTSKCGPVISIVIDHDGVMGIWVQDPMQDDFVCHCDVTLRELRAISAAAENLMDENAEHKDYEEEP